MESLLVILVPNPTKELGNTHITNDTNSIVGNQGDCAEPFCNCKNYFYLEKENINYFKGRKGKHQPRLSSQGQWY